jgi:medium-chain acyl-CoA synthetase
MTTSTEHHRSSREFKWEVPEYFNFGATIDGFAEDPSRVALLWEDQDGRRARLTFADIGAQSARIANVLASLKPRTSARSS